MIHYFANGNRDKRLLITVVQGVLALFILGVAQCGVAQERPAAFAAPLLADGMTFDSAALKGRVIVVHFWATWCPSCREEMPVLDDFYLSRHTQGVEVIAVSVDRPRARDKVTAYMRDFHFPACLMDDATANSFGTPGSLPVTYVVDTKGIVRAQFMPDKTPLTKQALEKAVLPLLTP